MKFLTLGLTATVSAAGLFLIGLIPQPASADVPCEAGTTSYFSNGSLASCVVRSNVNAGLNNNVYYCKAGHSLAFDEQGRFTRCVLSTPLVVRRGNNVVTCLANYEVSVSISSDGNQSVSCEATAQANHY